MSGQTYRKQLKLLVRNKCHHDSYVFGLYEHDHYYSRSGRSSSSLSPSRSSMSGLSIPPPIMSIPDTEELITLLLSKDNKTKSLKSRERGELKLKR